MGVVDLVVLDCLLRGRAKRSSTFLRKKVHPRQNPGYAYETVLILTASSNEWYFVLGAISVLIFTRNNFRFHSILVLQIIFVFSSVLVHENIIFFFYCSHSENTVIVQHTVHTSLQSDVYFYKKSSVLLGDHADTVRTSTTKTRLTISYKKLITRWDSERELFYDEIVHALQNNNICGSIAEVCYHAKIHC